MIRAVYVLPDETTFFVPDFHEIAISADGGQMAFNATDGVYLRQTNAFGAVRTPGIAEGKIRLNPVFSPDGETVAFLMLNTASGVRRE